MENDIYRELQALWEPSFPRFWLRAELCSSPCRKSDNSPQKTPRGSCGGDVRALGVPGKSPELYSQNHGIVEVGKDLWERRPGSWILCRLILGIILELFW